MDVTKKITLLLVLSEISFLYPLYLLAAVILGAADIKIEPSLSPWVLLLVAVILTLINFIIVNANQRNLTIILGNLVFIGATAWLSVQLSGAVWADAILIYLLFALAFVRIIYLSLHKTIDIYVHFDISTAVIFLAIVVIGGLKLSVPAALFWLLFSFLLNIAAVAIRQKDREAQGYWPWLGIGLVALVMVFFYSSARYFLPYLFQPAHFLYNVGRPAVGFLGKLLTLFFTGYQAHYKNQREQSSQLATDTSNMEYAAGAGEVPEWALVLMKGIYWLLLAVIAAVVFLLLGYLLYRLIVKLLQRQDRPAPVPISFGQLFSLRGLKQIYLSLKDRIRVYLLPLSPAKPDIIQAYDALLKWGGYARYPRSAHETPYEYLRRLYQRFPQHKDDLEKITNDYVQFKYRKNPETSLSPEELKITLRRLFYPNLN